MSSTAPQQSLRKHRQTLLSDERKKDYGKLGVPNHLPSVGIKNKQKIGDLVKKRLSSRVHPKDVYSSSEGVPSLPGNAAELINEASNGDMAAAKPGIRDSAIYQPETYDTRPQKGTVDKNVLIRKDFDPKSYISEQLSSSTDVEISDFADKLTSLQVALIADRKDAMYNNYKTFLAVGSEISTLGSALDVLRNLLSDLHLATTAMKDDSEQVLASLDSKSTSSLATENQVNLKRRNSMLMLENMWAQELASLFRHVEGAQKYLPAIPGRHVIRESGAWYQLNAATWRSLQPVHIFLLNDHLLIATKKRSKHGDNSLSVQPTRVLIADQCWSLQDIEVVDLSPKPKDRYIDPKDPTVGALCVRTGSLNFVYRTEKLEAHRMILTEFNKARAELKKLKDSSGSLHLNQSSNHSSSVAKRNSLRSRSLDLTGRNRNLREVEDLVNDLEVKIAYQQFAQAVDLIEENLKALNREGADDNRPSSPRILAEKIVLINAEPKDDHTNDTLASQLLKLKLEVKVQELIDFLLRDLSQEYLSKGKIKEQVQLLIRLKADEKAKKALLDSRHKLIRKRIKQVEFQEDIASYMSQVAAIHFRMVRSTVEIYNSCFTTVENSRIVEWVKSEIESYVVMFARQLCNIDRSAPVYQACVEVTKQESKILEDVGMNLSFMLSFMFETPKND